MRIRSIKPEFFTHEGLFEAESQTGFPIRVAFAGLWCIADRMGRFKWEPRRIGVQVLPYDQVDFSRVLDALISRGFVLKYRVGDEWFGCIPSFLKHQVINNKEKASVLPDCSENGAIIEGNDATTTRESHVDDACHKEGKGKEQGKEGVASGDASNLAPELEAFRLTICSWFNRRPTTAWSAKEIKGLKWAFESGFSPDEFKALEAYYKSNSPYKRKDVITLFNNWNGEIDRAREFGNQSQPTFQNLQPVNKERDWRDSL